MSQDTHLFSIRRPREVSCDHGYSYVALLIAGKQTLGGLNFNSAIPQPASAMKRSNSQSNMKDTQLQAPYTAHHARSQSSSRMSLAPSRPPQPSFQRSSSGGNLAEMGRSTVQRSSSSNLFSNRMSYAPGAITPRTQQPMSASQSLQRRSSVYSRPSNSGPMGQQSFFVQAPLPAGVPQDKRKLRDRGLQVQMATELEEYLSNNGFQMDMKHQLGPNSLKSPTGKDFNLIFQWLYKRIDPAYQFQKSIDNEVPPILKQLRYPFEKSITKSQLTAVGGNNWGLLLGMLHWIMQVAIMMERYAEDRYDDACAEEGVDVSGDKIIFRFLTNAYQTWLSCPPGEDEDEDEADKLLMPHVQAMAAEFERGNQQYSEELKVLEAENRSLLNQIEEIERNAPDITKLEEDYKILKSDLTKFEGYKVKVGEKVKQYEARKQSLEKDIEDWEKQLDEINQEKDDLQRAVDKQGISVMEIDRMNAERERLLTGVEAAKTRLEEVNQRIKEKENEASNGLSALEELVREFNSLCYKVDLRDKDFNLVINTNDTPFFSSQLGASQHSSGDRLLAGSETGYHPSRILNLDLRVKIKAQINGLRKDTSKRRNDAKDRDEENRRMLHEVSCALDDKKYEVDSLQHKVRSAKEEYEKTKEVC